MKAAPDASFPRPRAPVPWLTTGQMVEVDRLMVDQYGIDLPRMMENAGRSLARLAQAKFLAGRRRDGAVAVLAGPGGNGGGALVAARWLANHGSRVRILLARPASELAPVTAAQLAILERMGVPARRVGGTGEAEAAAPVPPEPPDLILDGVLGYGGRGNPSGGAEGLITWAGAQAAPVLALDTPSGVDTTTGAVGSPAIRAAATMTLALPKEGLRVPGARDHVGRLYLADIGVPPGLYGRLGLAVGPLFAQADILTLDIPGGRAAR